MSLVTYAADGRVGLVTLNRPDKLNAISPELKTTLVERFHEADRDPTTSLVVLRAEGRSFCAGYDISPNPARAARRGNALAWHAALAATKLAVNRGAECAGFLNAMHAGVDVLAALYAARTEVGVKFDEIREKEGLGAALRWRAAQFKE